MTYSLHVNLHGIEEKLTVEYEPNTSAVLSGFDALTLPFPSESCLGYPTVHAYFGIMKQTGYKRYCGFIQFIQRTETINGVTLTRTPEIDVPEDFRRIGDPYFSYGYPASLYDAPCRNLGDCDELRWTAFTYLVCLPTSMNNNTLEFKTGFTWGYSENKHGVTGLLPFGELNEACFSEHIKLLK